MLWLDIPEFADRLGVTGKVGIRIPQIPVDRGKIVAFARSILMVERKTLLSERDKLRTRRTALEKELGEVVAQQRLLDRLLAEGGELTSEALQDAPDAAGLDLSGEGPTQAVIKVINTFGRSRWLTSGEIMKYLVACKFEPAESFGTGIFKLLTKLAKIQKVVDCDFIEGQNRYRTKVV